MTGQEAFEAFMVGFAGALGGGLLTGWLMLRGLLK